METELKPCPFCGGKAKLKCEMSMNFWFRICCIKCEATTRHFLIEEDVYKAWNRRI